MNQKSDAPDWSSYKLGWEDGVMAERQSHRQTHLHTAPVDAVNTSKERVDETAERKHMTDLASVGEVGVWGEREWVGLTAEEIWQCNTAPAGHHVECHICVAHQNVLDFAEAIEAKLKEKNQ